MDRHVANAQSDRGSEMLRDLSHNDIGTFNSAVRVAVQSSWCVTMPRPATSSPSPPVSAPAVDTARSREPSSAPAAAAHSNPQVLSLDDELTFDHREDEELELAPVDAHADAGYHDDGPQEPFWVCDDGGDGAFLLRDSKRPAAIARLCAAAESKVC